MKATVQKTETFLGGDKTKLTTVYLTREDNTTTQFTAPTDECGQFTVGKVCEEVTSLPWRPTRAPRKPKDAASAAPTADAVPQPSPAQTSATTAPVATAATATAKKSK